jgi:upstream-binding transcription factor
MPYFELLFTFRNAAAYYFTSVTQHSKLGELHYAVTNFLWGMVPEKEKKKCIEEHLKKHEDYVREFDKFIRVNLSFHFLC